MPRISLIVVLMAGAVKAAFDLVWRLKFSPDKKQTGYLHTESEDRQRGQGWKMLLTQVVLGTITAYALAYLIALTGSYSMLTLCELIFWIWLGFDAVILWSGVSREKLAQRTYLIEISQHFVSLLLTGAIIIFFTKLI